MGFGASPQLLTVQSLQIILHYIVVQPLVIPIITICYAKQSLDYEDPNTNISESISTEIKAQNEC